MLYLETVVQNLLSLGLALLLVGSALWGQCASCPMFNAATTESHDCCHDRTPVKRPVHDRCPNDSVTPVTVAKVGLDTSQLLLSAAPAAAHIVIAVLPVAPLEAPALPEPDSALYHSPPDLCVLHSVFLV